MLGFCGYTFCKDGNSLDPIPSVAPKLSDLKISNSIFSDIYWTKDVASSYSTTVPSSWGNDSILLAYFEDTLNAGSINAILSQISQVKIKMRSIDSFNWTTIKEQKIDTVYDLNFSFQTYLNIANTEYEYAWVPILNGAEGNYLIVKENSVFKDTILTDGTTTYKFKASITYGDGVQNQRSGVFEPFNSAYPIVVYNAKTNYKSNSFVGKILGDYLTSGNIDRKQIVNQTNSLLKFLTNKKPKILKDWNGNVWMITIVDSPSINYVNEYGMGITNVGFSYVEIGSTNSESDLKKNGFL